MGDDRLRASLMASRHAASTWLRRDDVEHAVEGFVGARPFSRPVLLVWVPGRLLVLDVGSDGAPAAVLDDLPRPQLPDVREGLTWDSWRLAGRRVRVHRGWRAVAGWVEP